MLWPVMGIWSNLWLFTPSEICYLFLQKPPRSADIPVRLPLLPPVHPLRDQLYKKGLPGKLIPGDYFQENRTSGRPYLLLKIRDGEDIFYTILPRSASAAAHDPAGSQHGGRRRGGDLAVSGGRDGVGSLQVRGLRIQFYREQLGIWVRGYRVLHQIAALVWFGLT